VIPILTPDEAAALDRASAERGVAVGAVMERAGFEVARATTSLLGSAYGRRAVVVCGAGNNGGDGLVAARHLSAAGMAVTVILTAPAAALRDAPRAAFRRLGATEVRVLSASGAVLEGALGRADVCVDAVFGTGFHGPVAGASAAAMGAMRAFACPVVSVDIPSGVNGATGEVTGPAVAATMTVTFGCLKPGIVFLPGAALAGRVVVVDIGFPSDLVASDLGMLEIDDVARLAAPRTIDANKRSTGVVIVVAGSRDMPGAAVLATRAAYRAGAGLVTLASVPAAIEVAQRSVVEATYLRLPEARDGGIAASAWPALAERLGSVHAVALGPGLGRGDETASFVHALTRASPVAMVIDADGLHAFPGGADLDRRESPAVLTPHAGEFGRLTGASLEEIAADRVGQARKAARLLDAVVLLKGPRTVIAAPDGRAFVVPTGGPALATGGTGDVLTGTTAAWLARRLPPVDAAAVAGYVHGLAGDLAGEAFGDGATAADVAERLPAATLMVSAAGSRADSQPTLPMVRRS
jgi:ADP-dependent NAD(P)H-hydrate dehydratase / NAD(P)H-hydrate epimerase